MDSFRENCTRCHSIGGGRLTGPDLKNLTQRKDRAWLVQFLQSPQAMIDKGDGCAPKLKQEARVVVMPAINGMSSARGKLPLSMTETESNCPNTKPARDSCRAGESLKLRGPPLPRPGEASPLNGRAERREAHHAAHLSFRILAMNHGVGGARVVHSRVHTILEQKTVRHGWRANPVVAHDIAPRVDLPCGGCGCAREVELSERAGRGPEESVRFSGGIAKITGDVDLGVDAERGR
ncbi:MAG: c-type cytochrome [Acidobacteria bacterium]|nr:c-type cytochrome [Acidobacteriota bacterium]